jgi:hypothetical protein
MFFDHRIDFGNQYRPSPTVIDFINAKKDSNEHSKQLNYIIGWESVVAFKPQSNMIEIDVPLSLQNSLIFEGCSQEANPMEIIRELLWLYLHVRKAKQDGRDPSGEVQNLVDYAIK